MRLYARERTQEDYQARIPVHAVWELTLACNLKCLHCGSRAGRRRPRELDTRECLEVVDQLAQLGTREVSLIGGEAYLRRDWIEIIRAIRIRNMYCAIQTGGYQLMPKRLLEAVAAGLQGVGVSLDGLQSVHDELRGVNGSFVSALALLEQAGSLGLNTSVNTQISAKNINQLPELMEAVADTGAKQWQVQLTVAMGNAADNDYLLLQPYHILELMPMLADLYIEAEKRGLLIIPGNNIGYFGPYEYLWRGFGNDRVHWTGCSAGQTVIALEADGTVKGCPSLPTTDYAGGNIRDIDLRKVWQTSSEIQLAQQRTLKDLWGFCGDCYYAEACRGGCTWTSHSLLGRPGNNPYCHYRALELEKQGLRERIVKTEEANASSFAVGKFAVIMETKNGETVTFPQLRASINTSSDTSTGQRSVEKQTPFNLSICRGCNCYIWPSEIFCPHCGADVIAEAASYAETIHQRQQVISALQNLLDPLELKN